MGAALAVGAAAFAVDATAATVCAVIAFVVAAGAAVDVVAVAAGGAAVAAAGDAAENADAASAAESAGGAAAAAAAAASGGAAGAVAAAAGADGAGWAAWAGSSAALPPLPHPRPSGPSNGRMHRQAGSGVPRSLRRQFGCPRAASGEAWGQWREAGPAAGPGQWWRPPTRRGAGTGAGSASARAKGWRRSASAGPSAWSGPRRTLPLPGGRREHRLVCYYFWLLNPSTRALEALCLPIEVGMC